MQDTPPISIVPATPDQKPVVANLIQLYLHDMTEFMPFPVEPDGRFAYDFLDRFWRFPYLIMAGNEIAGFALVIDECPLTGRKLCFFMAEFFVLKPTGAGHRPRRPRRDPCTAPRQLAHRQPPRQHRRPRILAKSHSAPERDHK